MEKSNKFIPFFIISLLFFIFQPVIFTSCSQESISPEEAHKHIGENQAVCGSVASTYYSVRSKGQPTFLNLNKPYPNQIFTIVIWGSDRHKFENPPETFFDQKSICVTGVITTYRGIPQIMVEDPSQIQLRDK